ncbi:hypothetical protein GY45DRAFT_1054030 [Cubamyces sp. BRFM 1775]|nr:hypothetical protein GY45DRAFT_1054030 [Cubamyces sp. BRFM 1775]
MVGAATCLALATISSRLAEEACGVDRGCIGSERGHRFQVILEATGAEPGNIGRLLVMVRIEDPQARASTASKDRVELSATRGWLNAALVDKWPCWRGTAA